MNLLLLGVGGIALCIIAATMSKKEIDDNKLANSKTSDIKEHKKRNKKGGGLKIGGVIIPPKKMNNGVWVVGPQETGKSTKLFIGNLLWEGFPLGSKIITDLKGEIYNVTSKYRSSLGEECYLFEPLNPDSKFKYNPLEFCSNDDEVIQLAENILVEDNNEWQQMALPLWAGVLVWAYHQPTEDKNIPHAINLLNTLDFELIEEELNKYKRSKELFNEFKICMGAEKQLIGILTTLRSKIHIYTDSRIQANIKSSSINPLQLKNINTNIYIKYGIGDIKYMKKFLKIFYGQLLQKICNGKAEKQVVFMLDEFQNVGKINGFEDYCAYCRSSNVSMILGTQDLSKIYAIYGQYEGKSIINSMETKIILPRLSDEEALKYIEFLCGETEIEITEGEQKKKYKKHLFSVSDIRTLQDEEAILIIENLHPIKVNVIPYHKDKKLMKNIEGIKFGEVKWL